MDEMNDELSEIKGVREISQNIREAAHRGALPDLQGLEWFVTYTGDSPSDGGAVIVEMMPSDAFQMTRIDARTFSVKVVNPAALVTRMGTLRKLSIRISRRVAL